MTKPPTASDGLVMVVEDDVDNRETLSELLSASGWRVVGVGDGEQALLALRLGLRPRLILLDLMMPVMTGWEFRAEQLRIPAVANIPVAVMSACGKDRQTIVRELGEVVFLPKPINFELLLDILGPPNHAQPSA